jgi:hypothetical protein
MVDTPGRDMKRTVRAQGCGFMTRPWNVIEQSLGLAMHRVALAKVLPQLVKDPGFNSSRWSRTIETVASRIGILASQEETLMRCSSADRHPAHGYVRLHFSTL